MKWMGWSWTDLSECPADLLDVIQAEMRVEAEQSRRASRKR
jgi:hypothetical protein